MVFFPFPDSLRMTAQSDHNDVTSTSNAQISNQPIGDGRSLTHPDGNNNSNKNHHNNNASTDTDDYNNYMQPIQVTYPSNRTTKRPTCLPQDDLPPSRRTNVPGSNPSVVSSEIVQGFSSEPGQLGFEFRQNLNISSASSDSDFQAGQTSPVYSQSSVRLQGIPQGSFKGLEQRLLNFHS